MSHKNSKNAKHAAHRKRAHLAKQAERVASAVDVNAGRKPVPDARRKSAPALLAAVAAALNALETENISVTLAHGAVITNWGYVFPLGSGDCVTWEPRSRAIMPFAPLPEVYDNHEDS